jgi:RNA polymerase sigma-70 factor (ECF subfamily)
MAVLDPRPGQDEAFVAPTAVHAEQDLVAAVRRGDSAAFDMLVIAHYQTLVSLATTYVGTRENAEEIVQDVFLRIWARRTAWTLSGPLRNYLLAATRNGAISQLRHWRVERRMKEAVTIGPPDSLPILPAHRDADAGQRTAELQAAIEAAIRGLPPRMREAFVLSRRQRLTHAEIASVMGTSIKTVQEQIGRALRQLHTTLSDWI